MASILSVKVMDEGEFRDRDGEIERRQPYLVVTDGPVHESLIRRSPFIPSRRSLHETGDSIVSEVVIRERKGFITSASGLYDVEVRYTSDREKVPEEEDPLARPTLVEIRSEKVRVRTFVDSNGDPLRNTAGDLIEDEVDETQFVFHAVRNLPVIPRWVLDYANAVNRDDVRIRGVTWPRGYLRMDGIALPSEFSWENGVPFFPFEFTARYRPRPWNEPLLNRGFHELQGGTVTGETGFGSIVTQFPELFETRLVPILVDDEPIPEPAWLDADGKAFRDDDGRVRNPTPEEVVLIRNRRHPELPFRRLPW